VRGEVLANAALKHVGADEALEHRQHRLALLVRDGIEDVVDVVVRADRLADLPRRRQRVEGERLSARLYEPGVV
jgi:hypothetical protein